VSREQPNLKLPVERMEQLRRIGETLNLSLVDVIGHLVRKEIAAGTIKPDLPGITIAGTPSGVTFGFEAARTTLTPSQAVALAEKITSLVNGSSLGGAMRAFVEAQAPNTGLRKPDPVQVDRRGISLRVTIDGITKPFALDVARDLARLLRTAAAANA
jgi:hypothetical protein